MAVWRVREEGPEEQQLSAAVFAGHRLRAPGLEGDTSSGMTQAKGVQPRGPASQVRLPVGHLPRRACAARPRKVACSAALGLSGLWAVVNLKAVIDVEIMHHAGVFLDPVDDPVDTAPSGVAACEGPE